MNDYIKKEMAGAVKYFAVDTKRKEQTRGVLLEQMTRMRLCPQASWLEILQGQLKFVNRKILLWQILSFLMFVCLAVLCGEEIQREMLYFSAIVTASVFSILLAVVCTQDEAYKMEELAGSCFFDSGQITILRLLLYGGINLVCLTIMTFVTQRNISENLVEIGIYIVIPYFFSGSILFFAILFGRNRGTAGAALVILIGSYMAVFLINSPVYEGAALLFWGIVLAVLICVYVTEIIFLIRQIREGRRLCMN